MSKSNGDIPPNHGGIVLEPNKNDVLSGRGGRINAHPGNVQFRDLVKQYRGIYLSPETKKLDKVKVATKLVDIVRSMDPPGRFLKEDENGWVEIGDARARKKAGQAMREKADEIRREIDQTMSQNSSSYPASPFSMQSETHDRRLSGYTHTSGYDGLQNYQHNSIQSNDYSQAAIHQQSMMQNNMYPTLSPMKKPHISNEIQSSGLQSENLVAFDKQFKRLSSTESKNLMHSLRFNSLGDSNRSISTNSAIERITMSPTSDKGSSSSSKIDRRKQFQMSKLKSSKVPQSLTTSERNVLMTSSLRSIETRLSSNQSQRSLTGSDTMSRLDENEVINKSLNSIEMRSAKIDSMNESMMNTLVSDVDRVLVNSTTSISQVLHGKNDESFRNRIALNIPNLPVPGKQRNISGISGISDCVMKPSNLPPPWTGFENANATLPNLPLERSDNNHKRR